MAEEKFSCVACGEDYEHETGVQECKMCHRLYCQECISDEGICVPCDEEEEKP